MMSNTMPEPDSSSLMLHTNAYTRLLSTSSKKFVSSAGQWCEGGLREGIERQERTAARGHTMQCTYGIAAFPV